MAQTANQKPRWQYPWGDSAHPHVHPQKRFILFKVPRLRFGWLVTPVLGPMDRVMVENQLLLTGLSYNASSDSANARIKYVDEAQENPT